MKRSYAADIKAGEKVLLWGWVHEIRDLSKMKFLQLRDFSGIVQCVVKDKNLLKKITNLALESVIEIKGKAKKAKVKAEFARKNVEVEVSDVQILNKAERLPIQVNEKTIKTQLPARLDFRSLDIRKPKVKAIFKIQSTAANAFREFFYKKRFIEIQPPGIIATATEGGTDLFRVAYFEKQAYLAQSPQLYKQLAAISWERVFSTSTVWRAEKHDTTRHLNEVRQLDIEVAFADDMQIMKYLEDVMKFIVKKVIDECREEIRLLNLNLKIPMVKYLTYKEAVELLRKHKFNMKHGDDFEPEAERKLCSLFPNAVVFIYEWPSELKPFYIWPKSEKGKEGLSGGFDMLYNGIELSSGGQRVHIPDVLIKQLKSKNLNPDKFKWYIDAFRFGAPGHAGWSIGLERLTMALCSLNNIREACMFPRDRKRLSP